MEKKWSTGSGKNLNYRSLHYIIKIIRHRIFLYKIVTKTFEKTYFCRIHLKFKLNANKTDLRI